MINSISVKEMAKYFREAGGDNIADILEETQRIADVTNHDIMRIEITGTKINIEVRPRFKPNEIEISFVIGEPS